VDRPVFVIVDDLIFLSKIQQTARQAGIALEILEPLNAHSRLWDVAGAGVIVDLNHRSGQAVNLVQALKSDAATRAAHIVGFLSHVQGDLAAAARSAGCDVVMARSAFAQQLPELLLKLSDE